MGPGLQSTGTDPLTSSEESPKVHQTFPGQTSQAIAFLRSYDNGFHAFLCPLHSFRHVLVLISSDNACVNKPRW